MFPSSGDHKPNRIALGVGDFSASVAFSFRYTRSLIGSHVNVRAVQAAVHSKPASKPEVVDEAAELMSLLGEHPSNVVGSVHFRCRTVPKFSIWAQLAGVVRATQLCVGKSSPSAT